MASYGGAVKLTGESEYIQAIKKMTQSMKEMSSELKAVSSEYGKNDSSLNALKAKQETLNKTMNTAKSLYEETTKKVKDLTTKYDEQDKKHKQLEKSYNDEKNKLQEIGKELGTTSKEYKDQAKVVADLQNDLIKSTKAQNDNTIALSKARTEMNNAKTGYENIKKEVSSLNDEVKRAENPFKVFRDTIKNSGDEASKAAKDGFTTFKAMLADLGSKVIQKATTELKKLTAQVIQTGADFEASMSKVEAVSGATGEELEKLTKKAQEMGRTTKFTASESAEAFNYMAMAGWKTEDMLNGIDGVLNLAAASGADLATTSDIVTDALTAMGYSAKDAGRLADVMASASSNANTNVEMMGQTFKYVGSIAGSLGYSMEDTAVAIGLMANAGIKADQAGTSLRSIMSRLATNTSGARSAMEKLGIEIIKNDGSMRDFGEVMAEMRVKFKDLTDAQKANIAKTVAGQNALSGFLAIVNSGDEDFNKLTNAIDKSNGSAKRMADTMQDNLKGQMTKFKSQIEGVYIGLYKQLEPALKDAMNAMSKMVKKVDWKAFGNSVKGALDLALKGLKWIIDNHKLVINALKLVVAAFAVNKINQWTTSMSKVAVGFTNAIKGAIEAGKAVALETAATTANTASKVANTTATGVCATATGVLTGAVHLLNAAFAANPIGVVTAGIGLLAGAFIALTKDTDNLTEAEKKHKKTMEEIKDTCEEYRDKMKEVNEAKKEYLESNMGETVYHENLYKELQNITEANGKVKAGYEERAKFIVGQLNEAFGLEIKMTNGVIQEYDKLQSSIKNVIEAKKAKIFIDANEGAYTEAIKQETTLYDNLTKATVANETAIKNKNNAIQKMAEAYGISKDEIIQFINEDGKLNTINLDAYVTKMNGLNTATSMSIPGFIQLQQELNSTQQKWIDTSGAVMDASKAYNENQEIIAKQELALENFDNKNYSVVRDIYEDTKNYIGKTNEETYKNYQKEIESQTQNLERLKRDKNKYHEDVYNQMVKSAENRIKVLQEEQAKYKTTTDTGLKSVRNSWADNLGLQITEMTGKIVEFKTLADGQVQMYVDGIKQGNPLSQDAMKKLAEDTINELTKNDNKYKEAGENLIKGVDLGIKNKDKQSAAFKTIQSFGNSLLTKLKNSLKEKSPSKATREMGQYLLEGLSMGIADETKNTYKQVENVGKNVLDNLRSSMQDEISLATATADINANIKTTNSQKYDVLVNAFKDALRSTKIELDGDEVGKFVENTVADAIYN